MGSLLRHLLAQLPSQVQDGDRIKKDVQLVLLIDTFAVVVISSLAFFYYRRWSKHPLYGQNKGAKAYPFVGTVVPFIQNIHRLPDYIFDLVSTTPGHTIREVRPDGRVTFFTCNPANVEYILKTNFENYPKGQLFYSVFRELLGEGIFNVDDHLWKFQRKKASHVFTTRSLRDFAVDNAARETSDRLLPFLFEASESRRVFDLQDIFARFAFDNICQLGFGEDPKCLDVFLPRVKFAEAFDRATLLTLNRLQSVFQFWWTFRRALRIGQPNELRLCVEVIDEFALRVIKNRRQELALASTKGDQETIAGKADLLSMFMTLLEDEKQGDHGEVFGEMSYRAKKSMEEQKFRRESQTNDDMFLRDIITSFILAGRDTTTSALSWFFWLLSIHPNVESAILEEISHLLSLRTSPPPSLGDGVLRGGETKCAKSSSTFSFEELKGMHYLHAALTESMRLYPPVPGDMKTARMDDVWPDGTVIKADSVVVYHPYTMGRLEDLWGKDCLEFKPERWLKDGVFVPQSPYKYTAFQAGPRICLGKDMVMLQMKLICGAILPNFEILVQQDYKPQYLAKLTLSIQNGLPVTVRERKHSHRIHVVRSGSKN